MILYHGTNATIQNIDLNQSRVGKDFGLVAIRQAARKLEQFGEGEAKVYRYSFDEAETQNLNVLKFEEYTLNWARFVLDNRKNRTRQQIHGYDIVIGPIADDVVGYQIRRVEEGIINEEQFLEEIKFHTITTQYMFATDRAIGLLKAL